MSAARFEVVRVRRGVIVERFRPDMDRGERGPVRAWIEAMREDARRWGDSIQVRRARGNA